MNNNRIAKPGLLFFSGLSFVESSGLVKTTLAEIDNVIQIFIEQYALARPRGRANLWNTEHNVYQEVPARVRW